TFARDRLSGRTTGVKHRTKNKEQGKPQENSHHLIISILADMVPERLSDAISIKARLVKSNSRPFVNGPLSVTVTNTDFPLRGFVTFSFVPNGSFRCAAV